MSKVWIRSKKAEFVRDVLRDFCVAAKRLEEQFRYYDLYGRLRFDVLRDLLGEETNKGLLWRLKDTSHHLFRNGSGERLVGQFLDWGMGYIFHETIKLKEDSYQQENYGPWFRELQSKDLPPEEAVVCQELYQVVLQTKESVRREIKRIRFILFHCRRLFPVYLAVYGDNPVLARFLFEQNDLVRQVFGAVYDDLVRALYGAEPERLYILAAQRLRESGRMAEARTALAEAARIRPESETAQKERTHLENMEKTLRL